LIHAYVKAEQRRQANEAKARVAPIISAGATATPNRLHQRASQRRRYGLKQKTSRRLTVNADFLCTRPVFKSSPTRATAEELITLNAD
jgi:hypothetical protein